ncbi:hypothetical protein VTG60DRAFT_3691 [Thermothelomyces hinnuleus]
MPENGSVGQDYDERRALSNLGYPIYNHGTIFGHANGPKAVWDTMENSDGEQSEELKSALVLLPEDRRYIGERKTSMGYVVPVGLRVELRAVSPSHH